MNDRNHEHYRDPTASEAIKNLSDEEKRLNRLIDVIKGVCWLSGFELKNRVVVKSRRSGREYK